MSTPVRFALVGTGNISGIHAQAISEIPGAQLTAAYSVAGLAPFCEKWGIAAAASLDDLFARKDVDAVCITTPSGSHGEPAIAALKAGKHVLCEKPMEINVEKIDAIIAASKASGTILAAVFQSRFGEGARTVKRAVDAGRLGRLTIASAYVKWWRTQAYYDSAGWRGTWEMDGGGALM
ncbi:MAG: Gfo/Idh/MocA family oxidoreductase, partial [Chthoniobacteraceae bacterium]